MPEQKRKVERGKPAAKRKGRAKSKPIRRTLRELPNSPEPLVLPAPPLATADSKGSDLTTSPLIRLLLVAAAALALVSISVAALPLPALERLLASETHLRTEHVTSFVDGHRLDLVVAGVTVLLVAAVVALPTVIG